MAGRDVIVGIALEEACLSLEQLASVCAVEAEWITRRIEDGLLPSAGQPPGERRFSAGELRRVRRMRQIERDFDAVPELAALVADILEEMEELRAQLERRGFR